MIDEYHVTVPFKGQHVPALETHLHVYLDITW